MNKFSVVVERDDGCLTASVAGHAVYTWADTPTALVAHVVEALRLHLDDDDADLSLVFDVAESARDVRGDPAFASTVEGTRQ